MMIQYLSTGQPVSVHSNVYNTSYSQIQAQVHK